MTRAGRGEARSRSRSEPALHATYIIHIIHMALVVWRVAPIAGTDMTNILHYQLSTVSEQYPFTLQQHGNKN